MSEICWTKPHVLKVQDIGDHYRKKVKLQVRLEGKWLASTGLVVGTYVKVSNPFPGVLVIQCLEEDNQSREQSARAALAF